MMFPQTIESSVSKFDDHVFDRLDIERKVSSIDWPERHLVGLRGDPVPFHLAQELSSESKERVTALIAGTQSGKTTYGPWWLKEEIERTASPDGDNDYIVITSSYPLFKLKLLPAIIQVFTHILGIGRYWASDRVIELRNPKTGRFDAKVSTDRMWGRIILLSAESLGSLESATARAAWLDEAGQDKFTLKAYQAVMRRLSLHRGRYLITTTLYNLGWVKSQIIDLAKRGGKEYHHSIGEAQLIHTENEKAGICLIQYDSILNPEFSIEEFRDAESKMDPAEFKMFYRGIAAKLKSIIYGVFDPDIHVIPAHQIPLTWPRGLIGVDPIGQMIAAVWLAFDPLKSQLHLYRELEMEFGMTTPGCVNEILKESIVDRRIMKVVGGGPSENQARLDWNAAGLPMIVPPVGDVWSQIGKVIELLKEGSLVIHDSCPRIISDLGMMKRKQDKHGNYINEIENKEIWHLLDALRYIICWLAYGGDEVAEIVYNPVRI